MSAVKEDRERLVYSAIEASELLGISLRQMRRLIAAGEVDTISIGRRRLIPHRALLDYIDRRERAR